MNDRPDSPEDLEHAYGHPPCANGEQCDECFPPEDQASTLFRAITGERWRRIQRRMLMDEGD